MANGDNDGGEEMVRKGDITPEWLEENAPEVADELRKGSGAKPLTETAVPN